MKQTPRLFLAASASIALALVGRSAAWGASHAAGWNGAAAARYLDTRLDWWAKWPKAARDHGTNCVSCHTSLPAVIARPALRTALGNAGPTANEQAMYAGVVKRVRMWHEVEPYYPDQTIGIPKSSESRGVESVLNALFLATRDRDAGTGLSDDARLAFANMWALQMKTGDLKGGFAWLTFKLEPWESESASYWGAALAAEAITRAPGNYAASPEIAANLTALRAYLKTGLGGKSSLFTRMLVLWADTNLHDIVEPAQRQVLLYQLRAIQGADGGWSLARLSTWQRVDGTVIPDVSDGFATAIVTVALQDAGVPATDPSIKAARAWLVAHQDPATGRLPASSINKLREPSTDAYLFMSDAATGFAMLALADGSKQGK